MKKYPSLPVRPDAHHLQHFGKFGFEMHIEDGCLKLYRFGIFHLQRFSCFQRSPTTILLSSTGLIFVFFLKSLHPENQISFMLLWKLLEDPQKLILKDVLQSSSFINTCLPTRTDEAMYIRISIAKHIFRINSC